MSTRCYVVKKLKDGNYKGIYIHHDGYVNGGVGETLYNYYNNEEVLDKLLDLGDLSYLGETSEDNTDYWDLSKFPSNLNPSKSGSYASRGEDCPARISDNLNDFNTEDYCYLYDNGEWYVYNWGEDKELLKNLIEN